MDGTSAQLAAYLVPGSNETFYIPEFITSEEESYLIRKITESSQQKWKNLPNRRLQIWGGELTAKSQLIPQALPSYLTTFPDIIGRLRDTGAFSRSSHGQPNHIILNEYLPGQGIMPHEDGPSYYPVVATLSLGSHAVFHYYRYKPEDEDDDPPAHISDAEVPKGRSIDPLPILSVLLEPRSLVITRSELYTAHLHGIDDITEDAFPASSSSVFAGDPRHPRLANESQLRGGEYRQVVAAGGTLKRGVRYSLTCRDVERVVNLNTRTMAALGLGRR
ncbi:hypothetical protein NM688_g6734 [Phlebia brevispora]|uniref:Uncharacterized protein n=1 Tax=Phlebia brevispora TaxID=194682 RepID=A0ACC1SD26_9APHY|nr:hypothetical protein NM688_g6734 [Phlebia brevispora]